MADDPTKKPDEGEPKGKETDEQLTKLLENFGQGIQGLQQTIENLSERVESLEIKPNDPEPSPKKKEVEIPADIEALDRKSFMDLIVTKTVEKMQDEMKNLVEPIQTKIQQKEEQSLEERINSLIAKAAEDHKDFYDWKDEMKVEVSKNPYLEPEDAYQLARIKHPEKAKKLDEKYNPPKGNENEKKPKFGGLFPTSTTKGKEPKSLEPTDAAEKAWEEVFGAE